MESVNHLNNPRNYGIPEDYSDKVNGGWEQGVNFKIGSENTHPDNFGNGDWVQEVKCKTEPENNHQEGVGNGDSMHEVQFKTEQEDTHQDGVISCLNDPPVEEIPCSEESPVIDIHINNVVTSFNSRCHLNLRHIATEGINVIYKRENGMLSMKLRNPPTTASIWSSGKITCTGATSEEMAKLAARRFARRLQKLGYKARFTNFRVVNVLGTCSLPFGIRINAFSQAHPQNASYEPEIHPGVTYKIKEPKATLKIFSTGSITVTAPSVANISAAIEHIYPLVMEYKMEAPLDRSLGPHKHRLAQHRRNGVKRVKYYHGGCYAEDDEDSYEMEEEEENYESESTVPSDAEDFNSEDSQD